MRPAAAVVIVVVACLTLVIRPSFAASVSNLAATHHDGQTFLTWAAPTGAGWTYRVYGSRDPIVLESDLSSAPLGVVGDSTWCDVRLSRILGTFQSYAIDSMATPLTAAQGLCVITPAVDGASFYAVTAQAAGELEDRTLTIGANALADPVAETLALPRPVYQRSVIKYSWSVEIYTLWVSATGTSLFEPMGNRAGLAYDCGVVRGAAGGALMVRPHPHGQNFLLVTNGSGEPGEWRLTLDDPLPTADSHSWWYGYHENYDVTLATNPMPTTGTVQDYTFRRMLYTVEWARRSFPVDRARVYASGNSMGAIGSLWLAFLRPQLIAGIVAEVPRFDFSAPDDPNTTNLWNSTGGFRRQGDRLWGTVGTDLPSSDGVPVYDRLDMNKLAARLASAGMPPMIVLVGKNDRVLGWAEKLPFFAEMEKDRLGGTFFWDTRTHTSAGSWDPMRGSRYLYRYRNDRSYPALSRCSANADPGNGTATSGDSIGTINAFVEWDTTLIDRINEWSTTLRLRDLTATFGTVLAPELVTVDVTPRRLQAFRVVGRTRYQYTVTRLGDGAVVQAGVVTPDSLGLLTIPGVPVDRSGSVLRIGAGSEVNAAEIEPIALPVLTLGANPVSRSTTVTFTPESTVGATVRSTGDVDLGLYDVTGRRTRSLFKGPLVAGARTLNLEVRDLPSGVYFLVARHDGHQVSRRVVVAR